MTYTITYKLLSGIKNTIEVFTNSIAETIAEIEETFDSINNPIETIEYVKG